MESLLIHEAPFSCFTSSSYPRDLENAGAGGISLAVCDVGAWDWQISELVKIECKKANLHSVKVGSIFGSPQTKYIYREGACKNR